MKRVLLTTFPTAFLHYGGGEREIHLLNEALNSAEILSEIYGPNSLPLRSHDVVIHFSMIGGSEFLVNAAFEAERYLVLWPNLWFIQEPSSELIYYLSRFLGRFDAVVFKSDVEEKHFVRYFDLAGKLVIRLSALVSPKFFRTDVTDVFREAYCIDRYAIWSGIIEPQKNQLAAVRAFRDLDIDLVISGEVRDRAYFENCKREAGSNVHFLPAMAFGSEIHLSALKNSQFFIELPLDFPGTSALEASALGCKLLVTRCDWCSEILGDSCTQVDVHDEAAIRSAVVHISKSNEFASSAPQLQDMYASTIPLVSHLLAVGGKL